jgi:hypothetical protein
MLDASALSDAEIAKFWARVNLLGPIPPLWPELGACWTWMLAPQRGLGYGQFGCTGRTHPAHRIGHILTKGPIPAGFWIDHLCLNKLCVRHTEITTPKENVRRRELAKRGLYWEEMRHAGHGS